MDRPKPMHRKLGPSKGKSYDNGGKVRKSNNS